MVREIMAGSMNVVRSCISMYNVLRSHRWLLAPMVLSKPVLRLRALGQAEMALIFPVLAALT
jgi:hypothetical protein